MSEYEIDRMKEIGWNEVKEGDEVFIAGNLVNKMPTYTYGPHYVVDVEKRILKNKGGQSFFERWPCLFLEIHDKPYPPLDLSVSAWVEEVKKGKTIIGYARWVLKEKN